jgi:hypothetical protein
VNTGVWVRTDSVTFEGWARARSGLALPEELQPGRTDEPDGGVAISVPPLVAASLALHGWAEVAVTVRLTMPEGDLFGCFGLAGDLAAGLVRSGQDVRIGLFDVAGLVDEVIRLIPALPPPPAEAATGCVRITVHGADAAVAGWQQILLAGESQWRRIQAGNPSRMVTVSDVHRELAADLRFVITGCLAAGDGDD